MNIHLKSNFWPFRPKIAYLIMCCLSLGVLGMGSPLLGDDYVSCKLKVETLTDRCRFTLIVTNKLNTELRVKFPTGQQYDFIVNSSSGELVWQWSRGMMFVQAFTKLILNPSEEKRFVEEYTLPVGAYSAQGILTTIPDTVYTEWVSFTVKTFKLPVLKGRITKILDKLYFLGRDGTAYLIENPKDEFQDLQNKTVEITSYQTEPIPGTIDKKITIDNYRVEKGDSPLF